MYISSIDDTRNKYMMHLKFLVNFHIYKIAKSHDKPSTHSPGIRRKSDILLLIEHYLRYIFHNLEEPSMAVAWRFPKPEDSPHFCSLPAQKVSKSSNQVHQTHGTMCLGLVRSKNMDHLESPRINFEVKR